MLYVFNVCMHLDRYISYLYGLVISTWPPCHVVETLLYTLVIYCRVPYMYPFFFNMDMERIQCINDFGILYTIHDCVILPTASYWSRGILNEEH